MTWTIHEDTPAGDAHDVLLAAFDALPDDLSFEDTQQARLAISAALTLLDVVGDPSVDPGVTISLEGSAGSHVTVTLDQIPAEAPVPQPNVPSDANIDPNATVIPDGSGVAVAGTIDEPKTGNAIVDNVPGAASNELGLDPGTLPPPVPEASVIVPEVPTVMVDGEKVPVADPTPVFPDPNASATPDTPVDAPVIEVFPPSEPPPVADIPTDTVPVDSTVSPTPDSVPTDIATDTPVDPTPPVEPAPADVPPPPTEPAPVPVEVTAPEAAPVDAPAPDAAPAVDPILGPITEPPAA